MTTDASTSPAAPITDQPSPVKYHWVMTVQTADGRQATTDSTIDVIPGHHTRAVTYTNVLKAVKEWVGATQVTVLFFDLAPDQL